MIPTNELSDMRAALLDLLPDTCSILSATYSSDGQGGEVATWGTASTSACRLDMTQGREAVAGGAIQPFTSYVLSMPYDAEITGTNRVVHAGVTYTVQSVNLNQSCALVKRVQLERV